jgi:hypothetical protein
MNGGATTRASSIRALLRNLRGGARLALFLRVSREDFAVEPAHFALLAGFNLIVWLAAAYVRAGFAGSLNPFALTGYLAALPLVMLTGLVVAALYRRREQALLLMVALISADWLFEIVNFAILRASPEAIAQGGFWSAQVALGIGFVAWVFATALRAIWVCGGAERKPFAVSAAFVLLLFALLLYVFPQAEPWVRPEEPQPPAALAAERLFHLQGELIERELAAIAPGKPGVPELFFVGFAPDGSQDVFLREMRYVRKLFDERYATQGRSALLASGEEGLDAHPIATLTNLRRVLKRVGEVMNDDEDVLFLFVSGHGSRDHQLSAFQPGIEPEPANPTALARVLQDSGIRSRLVVISACYSGGFIEALRSDEAMVITAAASDRTSFGCAHGNEFTYFGGAFFRDALAKTRSFAEAFTLASELVTRQESAENLLPSRPQLWQGQAIGARLRAIEEAVR